MRRTAPGLFGDLEALIEGARTRYPQWHALIEPLRVTARSLDDPAWEAAARAAVLPARGESGAPLLDDVVIPVSMEPLVRLLGAIAEEIANQPAANGNDALAGWRPQPEQAVALIEASIEYDTARMDALASAASIDQATVGTIAALAAMPLLLAFGRVHGNRLPAGWRDGYCALCGAWPMLAELRGIERSRRLRCGRCAGDWEIPWLACPYCGEHHHERLGALIPERGGESRKVETCASCNGYIKTVATLVPGRAVELWFKDLETVELDLAALEHGLTRPPRPARPISVTLTMARADAGGR